MKITLGTTYYNCPDFLEDFLSIHKNYFKEVIVVDDGSTKFPAEPVIQRHNSLNNIKLFVVTKDYGFNSHGCRNLIMKQSSNDWVLLLDIDRHLFSPKKSLPLMHKLLDQKGLLKFKVSLGVDKFTHKLSEHESVNDFLVHKDLFFSVGGYDEELVGFRTGDRDFFKQIEKVGNIKYVPDIRIVYTRLPTVSLKNNEFILSSNNYCEDNDRYLRAMNIVNNRIKKPVSNKPILQFEWYQVK